jgi:ClpP class serine protease
MTATAKSLFRLTASLYNKPHLATPDTLEAVLSLLDTRNSTGGLQSPFMGLWGSVDSKAVNRETGITTWESGVGVIDVEGALTYRRVEGSCGEVGCSYEDLVADVETMAKAGVKTIVFQHASGGGEASHVFEAARKIRSIADNNNIQLIGYADTLSASAAYALLTVCDVMIANPSAYVGSVGCVVALLDHSAYDAKIGVKRIYITSAQAKVPFEDDGSFKPGYLATLQEDVSSLGSEFCQFVAENTGMAVEDVVATEAECFPAKKALELGLINSVMSRDEFAAFVTDAHAQHVQNKG